MTCCYLVSPPPPVQIISHPQGVCRYLVCTVRGLPVWVMSEVQVLFVFVCRMSWAEPG